MNWRDSGRRWQNRKHQNLSPHLDQHYTGRNLSGVTILELWNLPHEAILELWSLLKGPTFKRRFAWFIMVNFSQFQFLAQQPLPTPTCSLVESAVRLPRTTLTQPVRTSLDNMDPVLQVFGICVLITDVDR